MTSPIRHSDFASYLAEQSPFSYAYKKAEKLSVALHMVTSFMERNEPLYLEIREKSLAVLSSILSLHAGHEQARGLGKVYDAIMNILMFLDVAYHSGFLSEMNWNILRREYLELGNYIREKEASFSVSESSLPLSFFHVEAPSYGEYPRKEVSSAVLEDIRKGQSVQAQRGKGQYHKRHKVKEDRKSQILSIVRNKKRVSIKDISILIADCSRKTLQRELISLVKAGMLIRAGERRWSTYSIA